MRATLKDKRFLERSAWIKENPVNRGETYYPYQELHFVFNHKNLFVNIQESPDPLEISYDLDFADRGGWQPLIELDCLEEWKHKKYVRGLRERGVTRRRSGSSGRTRTLTIIYLITVTEAVILFILLGRGGMCHSISHLSTTCI
jgi:hypothetical protein